SPMARRNGKRRARERKEDGKDGSDHRCSSIQRPVADVAITSELRLKSGFALHGFLEALDVASCVQLRGHHPAQPSRPMGAIVSGADSFTLQLWLPPDQVSLSLAVKRALPS